MFVAWKLSSVTWTVSLTWTWTWAQVFSLTWTWTWAQVFIDHSVGWLSSSSTKGNRWGDILESEIVWETSSRAGASVGANIQNSDNSDPCLSLKTFLCDLIVKLKHKGEQVGRYSREWDSVGTKFKSWSFSGRQYSEFWQVQGTSSRHTRQWVSVMLVSTGGAAPIF